MSATAGHASALQPAGALRPDSVYVLRAADEQASRLLLAGSDCYITAASQMGKSSLRERLRRELSAQAQVLSIDLSTLQRGSLAAFFRDLFVTLNERISWTSPSPPALPSGTDEASLGLAWREYLRHLGEGPRDTILIFDELQSVLEQPPDLQSFFSEICYVQEARSQVPAYSRLTFCFLGRFSVKSNQFIHIKSNPIKNSKPLPLGNFSRRDLRGFQAALLDKFGRDLTSTLLDQVYFWTDGHPWLTHHLCYEIYHAENSLTASSATEDIKQLVDSLYVPAVRQTDDFIEYARARVAGSRRSAPDSKNTQVLRLYRRLLNQEAVQAEADSEIQEELLLLALCRQEGDLLRVQNRIIAAAFDHRWVDAQLGSHFVDAAIKRWVDNQRSRAYLLSGWQLADALVWLAEQKHPSPEERNFIRESEAQARRTETRLRQWIYILIGLILLGLSSSTLIGYQLFVIARQSKYISEIERALAQKSERLRELEQQLRLLEESDKNNKKALKELQGELSVALNDLQRSATLISNQLDKLKTIEQQLADSEKLVREQANALERTNKQTEYYKAALARVEQKLKVLEKTPDGEDDFHAFSHDDAVTAAQISYDQKVLMTGSQKGLVSFWSIKEGVRRSAVREHSGQVKAVAFAPQSKLAASAGRDGMILLWDVDKGQVAQRLKGHTGPVLSLAFAGQDKESGANLPWLLSGSDDGTARLWDVQSGKELAVLSGHSDGVSSVAFSGYGSSAITGSGDKTARVWTLANGRIQGKPLILKGHGAWVSFVWLNAAGSRALVGAHTGRTYAWRVDVKPPFLIDGGRSAATFERYYKERTGHGYSGEVTSMMQRDGTTYLASVDSDGVVWVWEAFTGRPLQELKPKSVAVGNGRPKVANSATFSSDGRYLVTTSDDGIARLWRVKLKTSPAD